MRLFLFNIVESLFIFLLLFFSFSEKLKEDGISELSTVFFRLLGLNDLLSFIKF